MDQDVPDVWWSTSTWPKDGADVVDFLGIFGTVRVSQAQLFWMMVLGAEKPGICVEV
jgi:hypothetical protein